MKLLTVLLALEPVITKIVTKTKGNKTVQEIKEGVKDGIPLLATFKNSKTSPVRLITSLAIIGLTAYLFRQGTTPENIEIIVKLLLKLI